MDAICEKADLTKGSFYYFFDSKEDLGLAVLEWSIGQGVQMLARGPYVRIVDPIEKAFAFLEHLERKRDPALQEKSTLRLRQPTRKEVRKVAIV